MASPSLKCASALLAFALLLPLPAQAQLWVESIGSTAMPPGGFSSSHTVYGMLGGRWHHAARGTSADAAAYFGSGTKAEHGRWLNGSAVVGHAWRNGASSLHLSGDVLGLRYFEPFRYSLAVGTARAGLQHSIKKTDLAVTAELSRGRYWTTYTTSGLLGGEFTVDTSGPLRLGAIGFELTQNFPATLVSAQLRLPRAFGRFYVNPTVIVAGVVDGVEWTIHAATLDTEQLGGGLRVARQVGPNLRLSAQVEHQVADLLLGTPANFGAGITASWKLNDPTANAVERARLVTVGERSAAGTVVEFKLENGQAGKVEVVGSFTNWDARAMSRTGKTWKATFTLTPGSHQFAFLVDGEWFIPEGAPGVVDDGFGRKNATVVIERM